MASTRKRVDVLRPHPDNLAIYGDADPRDAELLENIRTRGMLHPLLVTRDGVIISGHRRWRAAQALGHTHIAVTVFPSDDPLDILEALISANEQRPKTNEQLAREFRALMVVEEARAKQRMVDGGKAAGRGRQKQGVANLPHPIPIPKSREVVAKRLGRRARSMEKGGKVVAAIDELTELGKADEAAKLRRTLNTKSVDRAYRHAEQTGLLDGFQGESSRPGGGYLTLAQWRALPEGRRADALRAAPGSRSTFNRQETTSIEWAQWSWNPVTGCLHDCTYCYARDIAVDLYPQKFVPTFVPDRLAAPQNTRLPDRAAHQVAYRNVFTCSMADLFGRWVPREWIEAALDAARRSPQWNYLFLTKFPQRLREFEFGQNMWVGTTVDAQARVRNAEDAFTDVRAGVKWLSLEPLLEPLRFEHLDRFNWIVLGGASASTQTPEWHPPLSWILDLERQALAAGCCVYHKTNLFGRRREYPGIEAPSPINVPEAFQMKYLQRDVLEPHRYREEMKP
jgi:protein gp37/ParB-like chromosome segregation protein Spo0J